MTKAEFLKELRELLHNLPEKDINDSLDYYSEMIDERVESGMKEEEAAAELADPKEAAREIKMNMPISALIKSKCKKYRSGRSLSIWEIILLILGSPIWLSVAIALFSVVLAVYISVWAVFASLWAIDIALGAAALLGVVSFFIGIFSSPAYALLCLGIGLFSAGAAILMFFCCIKSTSLFLKLHLNITKLIKKIMIGRRV